MRLPNPDRALVDIEKLRGYCLSTEHPRGKHKARVFEAALGLTRDHAEMLRAALLFAARTQEAMPMEKDQHGQRFVMDFKLTGPTGEAIIRSAWITRTEEDFPRLATCYVLGKGEHDHD